MTDLEFILYKKSVEDNWNTYQKERLEDVERLSKMYSKETFIDRLKKFLRLTK